ALISDDRHWLASIRLDGVARLYDLHAADPTARPAVLTPRGGPATALWTSADGRWLGVTRQGHDVTLHDLHDPDPAARPVTLEGLREVPEALTTDVKGRWFAVNTVERSASLTTLPWLLPLKVRLWKRADDRAPARPVTPLKGEVGLPRAAFIVGRTL